MLPFVMHMTPKVVICLTLSKWGHSNEVVINECIMQKMKKNMKQNKNMSSMVDVQSCKLGFDQVT